MQTKPLIRIGTRGSDLALWQAHFVKGALEELGCEVSLQIIVTQGDRIQDLSFDKLEGKGFFTKEIEAALRFAESEKWRIDVGGSHAWGKMFCPFNQETCRCGEFCITSIWSTPRDAENHARALKRVVEKCEVRVSNMRRLIQQFIKIEKK